jgi:hypothetical protein
MDPQKKIFSTESFGPPRSSSGVQRPTIDACRQHGTMQMKRTLIRYRTRPETTQENQRLIENVFQELHAKSPQGVRYMVLKLDDGTFLHFVEAGDGGNPLLELEAFLAFQRGIKDRCAESPQARDAVIVGNYRVPGER